MKLSHLALVAICFAASQATPAPSGSNFEPGGLRLGPIIEPTGLWLGPGTESAEHA